MRLIRILLNWRFNIGFADCGIWRPDGPLYAVYTLRGAAKTRHACCVLCGQLVNRAWLIFLSACSASHAQRLMFRRAMDLLRPNLPSMAHRDLLYRPAGGRSLWRDTAAHQPGGSLPRWPAGHCVLVACSARPCRRKN